MKRKSLFSICILTILFAFTQISQAAIFYVSLTGNDVNNGLTTASPFGTVYKAVTMANPGDMIYVRGGTYSCATRINLSKTGTATQMNYLFGYPGEKVIFDFSSMVLADSNQGIQISGDYWYVKGISVFNAGDNGMLIQGGNYNRIENCVFYENRDAGFEIKGGGAYNKIINCDSYLNADPATSYGNADGFSTKIDPGTGNYYYGCRAWCNSDDGWDGYLKCLDAVPPVPDDMTTTLENCWTFKSGYLKDGSVGPGNGNGFKTGGSGTTPDQRHNQILINCLSFGNTNKGFDQNGNMGSLSMINCTSISNAKGNYMFKTALATGKIVTVENCISLQPSGTKTGFSTTNTQVFATNSFLSKITDGSEASNFAVAADFQVSDVATGYTQCTAARKANGSLPDITFAHLASTATKEIDAGTIVGNFPYLGISPVPYNGNKPDLGCFETGSTDLTPSYNLTINATGSGLITLDPATGPYVKGSVVTLIANANANNKFTSYSGDLSATSKIATIVMDGNKTVTANFAATAQYTLTVNVVGSGSVLLNPVNTGVYDAGTVVSLNAIANTGNLFIDYSGDIVSGTNSSSIIMDGNKTITATFTPIVAADWNTIQAETGTLVNATTKTDHAFTGTGYVDFTNSASDASVTLTANVAAAGCYDVNIYYAGIEDRPMNVYVNGILWANPACPNPGSYDIYAYTPVILSLNVGNNAIKFTGPGINSGPNFDRIEIKKVPRTGNCSPAPTAVLSPVSDVIQNLSLNPNLVDQTTTITFKASNNEKGKLSVFNLTGKLVFEQLYDFNIGANQKTVDLSMLNSGMYFGRLQIGEQMQSVKIMKK
ncbi:MAG: T9SS type A sorting domain-containing protein [Paludibacter sp.]|nr:T9SS type A sorting domain-containing protein [Paludibacter sp.]